MTDVKIENTAVVVPATHRMAAGNRDDDCSGIKHQPESLTNRFTRVRVEVLPDAESWADYCATKGD